MRLTTLVILRVLSLRFSVGLMFVGGLVVLSGCGSTNPPPDSSQESVSTVGQEDAAAEPSRPSEMKENAETPAPEKATTELAKGVPTNLIALPSSELTAGIPGEGALTLEQVEAWLADEKNHEQLDVELPLGLKVGQGAIQGLEANPLTRAKIELGRQLYFDKRLSADSTVSCADCHHPDEGFARHTQFGVGINGQQGGRNSPVSYNRILSAAQFWDGRAGSLEEQAVGPIANPIEMGNTHEGAVKTLSEISGYKAQFEKIFSDGVTIENVGRAIASFERVIVSGPSPFDYYEPLRAMREAYKSELEDLDAFKKDDPELYAEYQAVLKAAEENPISESAQRGREIFFTKKGGCTACHVGPNLTDEKYHNLGVGMDKEEADVGRFAVTMEEKDKGAFKTPTIRNVALSAPYMHDGSQKTLEEVVDWYNKGGHPNPQLAEGIRKLELTDEEKKDLVEFMIACTGEFPHVQSTRLPE